VGLIDVVQTTAAFYIIMELCLGGDLQSYIRSRPLERLDERVAKSFLRQISDGLMFLRERSILHRDLKPANVLLTQKADFAVAKLADFGFAKELTDPEAMTHTYCGSPLYMAPEVLDKFPYGEKADMWSVGCIFFEMLTGHPPYRAQSERQLLEMIKTTKLVIPRGITVDDDSILLIQKLLTINYLYRVDTATFYNACRHFPLITTPGNGSAAREDGGVGGDGFDAGLGSSPGGIAGGGAYVGRVADRPPSVHPSTATTIATLGSDLKISIGGGGVVGDSSGGNAPGTPYLKADNSQQKSDSYVQTPPRLERRNSGDLTRALPPPTSFPIMDQTKRRPGDSDSKPKQPVSALSAAFEQLGKQPQPQSSAPEVVPDASEVDMDATINNNISKQRTMIDSSDSLSEFVIVNLPNNQWDADSTPLTYNRNETVVFRRPTITRETVPVHPRIPLVDPGDVPKEVNSRIVASNAIVRLADAIVSRIINGSSSTRRKPRRVSNSSMASAYSLYVFSLVLVEDAVAMVESALRDPSHLSSQLLRDLKHLRDSSIKYFGHLIARCEQCKSQLSVWQSSSSSNQMHPENLLYLQAFESARIAEFEEKAGNLDRYAPSFVAYS